MTRIRRVLSLSLAFALFLSLSITPSPARAEPGSKKEAPKAAALPKNGEWLHGNPAEASNFSGKVTLLYFWDYTTINNIRELAVIESWYNAYKLFGLNVVFIHTPEFAFARKKENVRKAVERMHIPYPVLLDSDGALWEKYGNRSWPAKYLVGPDGHIVYSQSGEGMYVSAELALREQLQKLSSGAALPDFTVKQDKDRFNLWECGDMSTELYIGFKRAAWWGVEIANRAGVFPNQILTFHDRGKRLERGFFLQGRWGSREDYFEYMDQKKNFEDYLGFIYVGSEVYGVLSNLEKKTPIRVYVQRDDGPLPEDRRGEDIRTDDEGRTYIIVDESRLYYLVKNEDDNYHELRLYVQDKGFAAYVFAFSNSCLTEFRHL